MSIELLEQPVQAADPLAMLEQMAIAMELECERIDNNELHIVSPGLWRETGIWFTWRPELSTLQLGSPIDLKTPENKINEISRLVAMVNERLWIGHYDLWTEDLSIVYRNSAILPEAGTLDAMQAEMLLKGTVEAVERFYPAFNFLIWGDKTPEEALQSSMFETKGSA